MQLQSLVDCQKVICGQVDMVDELAMETRGNVLLGVLLVLLIKGSHFGATPWDSYQDSLSTHQFEACHPQF